MFRVRVTCEHRRDVRDFLTPSGTFVPTPTDNDSQSNALGYASSARPILAGCRLTGRFELPQRI